MNKKKTNNILVAIERCSSYTEIELREVLLCCLDSLGGIRKFVKPGNRVLLKANQLCSSSVGSAVTTHPEFVRAVIKIVKAAQGTPVVGDSPALQPLRQTARSTGIARVCEEEQVMLVELEGKIFVRVKGGKVSKELVIARNLCDYDVIINLPKAKTHMLTTLSGAVKNLYGVIPGREKAKYHVIYQEPELFSELLLDLESVVPTTLCIMDAVIGMEGPGPRTGTPKVLGYLVASEDNVAVDYAFSQLIGFREQEVPLLVCARNRKMRGVMKEHITYTRLSPKEAGVVSFKRPRPYVYAPLFVRKRFRSLLVPKPVIDMEACTKCYQCVRMCPVKAIREVKNKPVITYDECIRCYCCHEVCPDKAIIVKSTFVSRLFRKI